MMEKVFLTIANMSFAASWIMLVVLILRLILKKIPRAYICMLWALVGTAVMVIYMTASLTIYIKVFRLQLKEKYGMDFWMRQKKHFRSLKG